MRWRRRASSDDDDSPGGCADGRPLETERATPTGLDGEHAVWPGKPRPTLPHPSPRALAEDWLRSLTISAEPGMTPDRAVALINQVNRPGSTPIQIRTPLPADDAQALKDSIAWNNEMRSRQAWLNLLVEGLLIDWLADATGQDRNAVIQRLALAVDKHLTPGVD
ncbi:MAG: hypothetical protein ACRCYU_12060 [Nocardioides sp.]